MIKRTIKYTDLNGNEQQEDAYFHIGKAEMVEMEVEHEGGLVAFIQHIVETEDRKELIAQFKQLILMSYGIKGADGKGFEKSDELRTKFKNSMAYDSLFMELATDDTAAAEFVNGIVPADVSAQVAEQDKPTGPPPAPSTALTPPAPPA